MKSDGSYEVSLGRRQLANAGREECKASVRFGCG